MMKHPKTTLAGIATIVAGIAGFAAHALTTGTVDGTAFAAMVAAITTGLGLIKSADADKV
jgi:hypothetical protein